MNAEAQLDKIKEHLYLWLVDINAGDRPEYVIGDMWIYRIIHDNFPDLADEIEEIRKNPPLRAAYFGDS